MAHARCGASRWVTKKLWRLSGLRRKGTRRTCGRSWTTFALKSTAGNLNFSDDLLPLDQELVDYVIVHELLHFFVPNHGKLWKSLMRAHLGDYERAESKLRNKAAMLSR